MSAIAVLDSVWPIGIRSQARTEDTQLALRRHDQLLPAWLEDEFWVQRKRVNVERRQTSLVLAVPLVALFGLLDGYIAPDARAQLLLIRFGIFTPLILALLVGAVVRPRHRWSEEVMAFGVVAGGVCVTAMTLIAPLHYAGILLVVLASYTFLGLRCTYAGAAGMTVSAFYVIAAMTEASMPWAVLVANAFFLLSANVIGAFACYTLEQAARREFSHDRALSEQRQVSERLLRNVLPTPVAQRLKAHAGSIADAHPDVTILFADIVDFTGYAASVAPTRLVEVLDKLFTCFDQLAQRHGLEKIKTIGDAYMVAGGLHDGKSDHVRRVAEMALDMIDAVRTFEPAAGKRLALRIGIHAGPVVAGVIGKTKFAYDVWGDTVNVASRLQELAMPGTIQVSESAQQRLHGAYEFEPRRVVPMKGRGDVAAYLLLARATAAASCVEDPTNHAERIGNAAPSSGHAIGASDTPGRGSRHPDGDADDEPAGVDGLGKLYADHDIVVRQGDTGECMFAIQAGSVEVVRETPHADVRLAVLKQGDIFGEMAIFEKQARSATVRALGAARLLRIDKATFLRRMHEDPSVALNITRLLCNRIRRLSVELASIKRSDAEPST